MVSEVGIINAALSKIDGNEITAIGQDGVEGEVAQTLYTLVRDALLAAHPWNFAIGRSALTLDATSPSFEFDNQYLLPADCLRCWKLYDTASIWRKEGNRLLTNDNEANLIYIKKVTDTGLFSPGFTEALIVKLAAEMTVKITGSQTAAQGLYQEFKDKLKDAKKQDGQEGIMDDFVVDTFTSARYLHGGTTQDIVYPTTGHDW